MGSPLSNLYQHYFGHVYPALDKPYWATLRSRVDRWANIFRIDDPVGTEIDFEPILRYKCRPAAGEGAQVQGGSDTNGQWSEETAPSTQFGENPDGTCDVAKPKIQVSNHPVGCRGHVNYWTDREVLNIVHDIVLEPESHSKATGRAA